MPPIQKVEVSLDQHSRRLIQKLTEAVERNTRSQPAYYVGTLEETEMPAHSHTAALPEEYYDDNTLLKVYSALTFVGMTQAGAQDAVSAMQNAGILFRERR